MRFRFAKALGAEVTGVSSTRSLELLRSLGEDHVIDYTKKDFTSDAERYDVILDNVMNHRPSATARVLVMNRENLEALAALLESGDVKVVIDKVYPLNDAADAVAYMLGHHARGKVAVAV